MEIYISEILSPYLVNQFKFRSFRTSFVEVAKKEMEKMQLLLVLLYPEGVAVWAVELSGHWKSWSYIFILGIIVQFSKIEYDEESDIN